MERKSKGLMRKRLLGSVVSTGLMLFLAAGTLHAEGLGGRNDMPPQGPQEGQGGPGMGPQGNGSSRIPPQAAMDACSGRAEGTACEFTDPRGSKTGSCVFTPDRKYFACRPNDMQRSPQGQQEGQKRPGQRN